MTQFCNIQFAHSIILTIIIPITLTAQLAYVTVYGKVASGTVSATKATSNYIACKDLCVDNPRCVLAYGNKNCRLYYVGKVDTVTQMNQKSSGSEDIVTFRVDRDGKSCPAKPALNPPTFDNYPANGNIELNGVLNSYVITYNKNTWTFSTLSQDATLKCPSNYMTYKRKYGMMCVRLISKQFPALCADYSKLLYLSSIEDSAELSFLQTYIVRFGPVKINATVTPECRKTGNCEDIMLGPYLVPPARIPWLPGYPTATGDCVALSHVKEKTCGMINFQCDSSSTEGLDYCVELL